MSTINYMSIGFVVIRLGTVFNTKEKHVKSFHFVNYKIV